MEDIECRTFCAMLIGPRKRQEDCLFDGTTVFQTDLLLRKSGFSAREPFLIAVCDGMGGHHGGEIASMFTCEQLQEAFHKRNFSADHVIDTMADIQTAAMHQLPANSGTTVAGLLVGRKKAIAFNAGDSRIYRLTTKTIECISHDHSKVQEMIDKKLVDTESASRHPMKNLIDLGIGTAFSNAWSVRQCYVNQVDWRPPAYYLVCSDGLTDIIAEHEIHQLLMPDPVEYGSRLYNTLKQMRLKDNTSFVIAEIR